MAACYGIFVIDIISVIAVFIISVSHLECHERGQERDKVISVRQIKKKQIKEDGSFGIMMIKKIETITC